MPGIEWNEISLHANGGTEYMARELEKRIDPSLLERFQIFPSRVMSLEVLDPERVRILWLHDLPGDPASDHLANGGWQRFHALVFVSNWQMQSYVTHYDIPWSKCVVLPNAIDPVGFDQTFKDLDKVRLVYSTTPHRGLEILYPVFLELQKKYGDAIHLDVFSSFAMYGEAWKPRDEPYEDLFEALRSTPGITYHGAQPRDVMLGTLRSADIFAYPSIWQETSCLCLIEAMSAGLDCVHPNLGALYETAGSLTSMYQYDEDKSSHGGRHHLMLDRAIEAVKARPASWSNRLEWQSKFASTFYNWETRSKQWEAFLKSQMEQSPGIVEPEQFFTYRA